MSHCGNRAMLELAFAETARGNGRPFVEMLADDARWEIIGTTEWSRAFAGKAAILSDLLGPLAANFDGPNLVSAHHYIGEGDTIAVEGRNHSVTTQGEPYANRYCWIFRFRDGRVYEIIEYCDTDLVARLLRRPL